MPVLHLKKGENPGTHLTRASFPSEIGVQKAKKRKATDPVVAPSADVLDIFGAAGIVACCSPDSDEPEVQQKAKKSRKGVNAHLLK